MKMLLFLAIGLTISLDVLGQEFPSPFRVEKTDTVTGTKAELFEKANEWALKTNKSAKSVIQMKDKEAGKIIGSGMMTTNTKIGAGNGDYYTTYTLAMHVKDGRCRIVLADFETKYYDLKGYKENLNYSLDNKDHPAKGLAVNYDDKMWQDIKNDCLSKATVLTNDLFIALRTK